MKLPQEYNYISASLTLRCNLGCSYCINAATPVVRARDEMPGDRWVASLNALELPPDMSITLEGGEPSMHLDFYQILAELKHPVCILTNLMFDVQEFIRRVDPRMCLRFPERAYKAIRVSYHASRMDQGEMVARAIQLQEAGFSIGLFGINHPDAVSDNIRMAEMCRRASIYFFVKDYLGTHNGALHGHYRYPAALNGITKQCMCRTNELLIAPNGQIFRCHRDMYASENPIGQIDDPATQLEYKFRMCSEYGNCNPCDVKLKTNRFLQHGNSSVEIKQDDA
jgi:hypothetical protein